MSEWSTPHASRVSRVELEREGRCRALRVVELGDGSVVVTNGLEHSQAVGEDEVGDESEGRVNRLTRRLLAELDGGGGTDATNKEVVDLTALLLPLPSGVRSLLAPRPALVGAPFLSATTRLELVREGPIDPRLLSLLRDFASGAPLEWALRRTYG